MKRPKIYDLIGQKIEWNSSFVESYFPHDKTVQIHCIRELSREMRIPLPNRTGFALCTVLSDGFEISFWRGRCSPAWCHSIAVFKETP